MKTFPKKDVELYIIFKTIRTFVLFDGLNYVIQVSPSEVKSGNELESIFEKVKKVVVDMGFSAEFISKSFKKAYCREHKSFFEIKFNIK